MLFGTSDSTAMTITSSGNVGIGTTSPADILHIQNDGVSSYATTTIRNANSTAYLNIGVAGSSVADSALRNNAYIIVPTAADLLFRTSNAERMRITAGGDVSFRDTSNNQAFYWDASAAKLGIGTNSPTAPLTVFNSADPEIVFGYNSTQYHRIGYNASQVYIHADPSNSNANSALGLYVDNQPAIYVNSSQNVGIGTTSPSATLHANVTGNNTVFRFTRDTGTNGRLDLDFDGANSNFNSLYDYTFQTNGTERMRITSSGVVQVRNQTPTIQLYNTDNGLELNQTLGDIDWYQIDPSDQGVGTVAKIRAVNASTFAGYGELAFHTGSATSIDERVRINYQGNVGIGTTSPSAKLHVVGDIVATGDVTAYYSSDERLKENKKIIENATDKIEQISGYEFDWIAKEGVHINEGHDVGVMAQEVEKILPEVVTTRENGYKAVKYEKLVPLLIESIKELSGQIKELRSQINI
jgi:hypothetical protein